MKKTLLIASLALITISGNAQTQAGQQAVRTVARLMTAKAHSIAEKQLPVHSTTYDYDGTNNFYLYESDYTYNADGTLATEVQRKQKTPQTRISYTYDPVATAFLTLSTEAAYDAATQTWGDEQTTFRYDITRNAAGQITKMVEYDTDGDEPTAEATIDITYKTDGTPNTLTIIEEDDLMGELELTLSDITWCETGGNQIAEMGDIFSLISGGKQLEKATLNLPLQGLPLSGPLTVTYADNGDITANASLAFYGTTYMTFTIMQTQTDTYGSYQLDVATDIMNQKSYSRNKVTIDDHGNSTLNEEYEGTTADDLEKTSSEKTEYSYADFMSVTTVISYSWDDNSDTYSPYEKVVYDEFTTDIQTTAYPTSEASTHVYSLDGTLLGSTTDNLPAGLYIVRHGNHTVKLMKR